MSPVATARSVTWQHAKIIMPALLRARDSSRMSVSPYSRTMVGDKAGILNHKQLNLLPPTSQPLLTGLVSCSSGLLEVKNCHSLSWVLGWLVRRYTKEQV